MNVAAIFGRFHCRTAGGFGLLRFLSAAFPEVLYDRIQQVNTFRIAGRGFAKKLGMENPSSQKPAALRDLQPLSGCEIG